MTGPSPVYIFAAQVERVVDADTVDVAIDLGFRVQFRTRLRIAGIDAPELHTPEGKEARAYVVSLLELHGLEVTVRTYKPDKYGRALADVMFSNGESLADVLVAGEFAVPYQGGARG